MTSASHHLRILLAAFCALLSVGDARAGTLYVSNFDFGTIDAISSTGAISTYATIPPDPNNGSFNYEIAFDHSGNLFVADPLGANGTGTVYEVAPSGSVSTFATGLGALRGIAVDTSNNVYVSGYTDGTITQITPSGAASTYASGISGVFGLAFDPLGNLYASAGNDILRVLANGSTSVLASNIASPLGLTTDAFGNVYAATSNGTNTVVKVTPVGSVSTYASGIPNPTSLAFDSAGNLFVGDDFGSHSITRITPSGGSSTFVNDSSLNPWGLAFQPGTPDTLVTPEPSSLCLFGMASVMLGGYRGWRRKKAGAVPLPVLIQI